MIVHKFGQNYIFMSSCRCLNFQKTAITLVVIVYQMTLWCHCRLYGNNELLPIDNHQIAGYEDSADCFITTFDSEKSLLLMTILLKPAYFLMVGTFFCSEHDVSTRHLHVIRVSTRLSLA